MLESNFNLTYEKTRNRDNKTDHEVALPGRRDRFWFNTRYVSSVKLNKDRLLKIGYLKN